MLLYAITIFLSAFLLFLVQPLIGKYILPWFGGGSGVWTACMLFYQAALLAGYGYAHLLATHIPFRKQWLVHVVMLGLTLVWLPIIPDEVWKPESGDEPVAGIIVLLLATIGLPFIALSATGPLLQHWFSRTHRERSPYRLYALSNAGSLLALVAYPFVVEPAISRRWQALAWSIGFAAFVAVCAFTAWRTRSAIDARPERNRTPETIVRPTWQQYTLWLALPACASIMLLACTSQLSEEVAPIPFLWVLTLGAYLLTFIIAFEWPRLYVRPVMIAALVASPWLLRVLLREEAIAIRPQIAAYTFVLFTCGLICHGELYRMRPHVRHLTAYYLCIAAGGALGGAFVAIVAPVIFDRNLEIYLTVYAVLALALVAMFRDPISIFYRGQRRLGWMMIVVVALGGGLLISMRLSEMDTGVLVRTRNFYGTLAVRVHLSNEFDVQYRMLLHGRINHGAQHYKPESPEVRRLPTEYYGPRTGIGALLLEFPKKTGRRVGVVGLGVGTLATFAQPGDTFRFYEINAEVIRLAEEYFSFLTDARARGATIELALNDARLAMEQEPDQNFDLLVLDAFSGDAIPTHLLTAEAFEIYNRHLAPDGAIIVHVSNRYVDLHPVAHMLGLHIGLDAVFLSTVADPDRMISEAHWILLTRNQEIMNLPSIQQLGAWPPGPPKISLWTDDHASVIEVMR